jgi:hypothetical protein
MKFTQTLPGLTLALLLHHVRPVAAQTNLPAPPPTPATFSRFISERNIFDPNRSPRFDRSSPRTEPKPTRTTRETPTFTLVGTMSYEKGLFAFFDGSSPELRKILCQSDSNTIAGYSVAEITLTGARLLSIDKKETLELKLGERMRQEENRWRVIAPSELPPENTPKETPAATPAPAAAGEPNDILKKLMQKREQELK